MKVFEALKLSSSILNGLADADVKIEDVKYLELYGEYCRMKREEHKIVYIVAMLSDVYGVAERTVYNIIKKFEKDI